MQNPGSSEIVEAMRSVPFKVCTEIFMTETAKEWILCSCSDISGRGS